MSVDLTTVNASCGASGLCLRRTDLHDTLQRAFPKGVLRLGADLKELTQHDDHAVLQFTDGSRSKADWVLAPDGVHSGMRARIWADGAPRYAGNSAVLALADTIPQSVPLAEAAVLAALLAQNTHKDQIADTYRNLRAHRVNGMAQQARMIGQLAQYTGPLAKTARRWVFGAASEKAMQARFQSQFTLPAATCKLLDAAGLRA